MADQLLLQPGLDARPLLVRNAEVNRVTDPPRRGDHVLTERALLDRPKTEDRPPRPLVERIRLEFDAVASERPEGVAEHEQLRLGVHRRPLPRPAYPRPTNLDPAVSERGVSEPSAPDDGTRRSFNSGEGEHVTASLPIERDPDVGGEVLGRADRVRSPPPEVGVEADGGQGVKMVERERFESDVLTFEDDGF